MSPRFVPTSDERPPQRTSSAPAGIKSSPIHKPAPAAPDWRSAERERRHRERAVVAWLRSLGR